MLLFHPVDVHLLRGLMASGTALCEALAAKAQSSPIIVHHNGDLWWCYKPLEMHWCRFFAEARKIILGALLIRIDRFGKVHWKCHKENGAGQAEMVFEEK